MSNVGEIKFGICVLLKDVVPDSGQQPTNDIDNELTSSVERLHIGQLLD